MLTPQAKSIENLVMAQGQIYKDIFTRSDLFIEKIPRCVIVLRSASLRSQSDTAIFTVQENIEKYEHIKNNSESGKKLF